MVSSSVSVSLVETGRGKGADFLELEIPTDGLFVVESSRMSVSIVETEKGMQRCLVLGTGKIDIYGLSGVEISRMSVSIVEIEKGMQRCLVLGTGKSDRWFVGDENLWDERLDSGDRERHAKLPSSWNWKI